MRAVSPLTLTTVPTPPFRIPRYDTSGSIPQVYAAGVDLVKVNTALRELVLADQRSYAPNARASAKVTGARCRGTYKVVTDRALVSASTVVASALLATTELYPCGNDGEGWLAVTVNVPSGKQVALSQLFRDAEGEGIPKLGVAWFRVVARANDWRLGCVVANLRDFEPSLRNYRHFALTPRGLAVGFDYEPACGRIEAVVPYADLRPYLSGLGKRLVAAVRQAN